MKALLTLIVVFCSISLRAADIGINYELQLIRLPESVTLPENLLQIENLKGVDIQRTTGYATTNGKANKLKLLRKCQPPHAETTGTEFLASLMLSDHGDTLGYTLDYDYSELSRFETTDAGNVPVYNVRRCAGLTGTKPIAKKIVFEISNPAEKGSKLYALLSFARPQK